MKARAGDARPLYRSEGTRLHLRPCAPIRWLPRHGQPFCLLEWLSQRTIMSLSNVAIYVAVVAFLTIVAVVLYG